MRSIDIVQFCAQAQHRARRLLRHVGEVFARHDGLALAAVLCPEQVAADRANQFSDARIVEERRVTRRNLQLVIAAENPHQRKCLFHQPVNLFARLLLEGAYRASHEDFVGDDIVGDAGVNRAYGHHRPLGRVAPPRADRLQGVDDLGLQPDWIQAIMRRRPVRAFADDPRFKDIGRGQGKSIGHFNQAHRRAA